MGTDEEVAMKKLVVSALAYYGLKVFHIFDGREFKACLKLIESDKEKALEAFTEVVNGIGFQLLEKFATEFCRPDLSFSTPAAHPTELQSQLAPEPVLKLVAPDIAEQGNLNSSSIRSRIWATLSTYIKDNSGHYVVPYRDRNSGDVEAKINDGVQLQGKLKVEDGKFGIGDLVQNMNVNGLPLRKKLNIEEPGHCEAKRLRIRSVGEEVEKAKEPGQWQENLAKEWPHIFYEIQEHVDSDTNQTEMEERLNCADPPHNLPALIEVEIVDVNNMQKAPYLERKRKRARGTDEKASGGTLLYDSSLESIGRGKDKMNDIEIFDADFIICSGDEKKLKSEVGSSRTTANADLQDTGQKRNKTSWPAPLYGDQTRVKSSSRSLELPEEGEICTHELQGEALNTCPICRRKEEIAFSKYTRLFKDDLTWKQKFLDGENLFCDICSSKGKITTFTDATSLLSHARKGLELRAPEHRGYAKAIYNLIQLSEPGNIRTCLSAVGKTTPVKAKRVWPPVIVLENTFNASDFCLNLSNLDQEVTRRLKGFVNVDEHTLHKIMVSGYFEGTILVEFPRSRRGLNDANRLNQHFLLTGRSLQDWIRIQNKHLALTGYAAGVQEVCDLVKIGERGEILSRIYFGYQATVKIMTRLDTFRQCVKWRVREAEFVENECAYK